MHTHPLSQLRPIRPVYPSTPILQCIACTLRYKLHLLAFKYIANRQEIAGPPRYKIMRIHTLCTDLDEILGCYPVDGESVLVYALGRNKVYRVDIR